MSETQINFLNWGLWLSHWLPIGFGPLIDKLKYFPHEIYFQIYKSHKSINIILMQMHISKYISFAGINSWIEFLPAERLFLFSSLALTYHHFHSMFIVTIATSKHFWTIKKTHLRLLKAVNISWFHWLEETV